MLYHQNFKQCKSVMRAYLQSAYSDERLAALLAHAQSGRLVHYSCCCFHGAANSKHALASRGITSVHTPSAAGTRESWAYNQIGDRLNPDHRNDDALRRRILVPMIRAEMRRREHAAAPAAPELAVVSANRGA